MNETVASYSEDRSDRLMDRRRVLCRLAATSAVAWVAPEVIATRRASALALSGCYTEYDFDDGTLQGWTTSGAGPSRWQLSSLHSNTGAFSAWFGRAGTTNSLHPIVGQPSFDRGGRSRGTLTSPATTASSTDVICFQVRLAIESAVQFDVFRLFIAQGSTRVQLWDKHQAGFTVLDHPQNPGAPWDMYTTLGAWVEVDVDVGNPSGIDLTDPVRFEFDFQTVDAAYNRTEGIYLDNIMLPCSTSPGAPAAPALAAPSLSSAAQQSPPAIKAPGQVRELPPD